MIGLAMAFCFGGALPALGKAVPWAAEPADASVRNWVQELHDPNPKVRAKAAHEIGKSGDLSALPALIAALKDPSSKVRREVVLALASFRNPQELDGLIEAAKDSDSGVRNLALQGIVGYYTGQSPNAGFTGFMVHQYRLAKRGYKLNSDHVDPGTVVDPKAIAVLETTMMDTRFSGPSREAAQGLGILLARSAVPDLIRAAHSTDTGLALEALNSLAKIADTSAGPQLLNLLDSSDGDVQREAAITLGILRTQAALPKLQTLYLNSSNKDTRQSALEGLAYLGNRTSVSIFLKALWSEDKSERIAAAEGLARAKDARAMPDLRKAIGVEKNALARLAMQFAITAMGQDDYLSQMVDTLNSSFRSDVARSYLIELARDPAFLPKLYPYLGSDQSAVREGLADVLMYSGDRSSLPPLERLSKDKNSDVAAAALRALRAVRWRTGAV